MTVPAPSWLVSWGTILLKNIRWIVFPMWTEGWLSMNGIMIQSLTSSVQSTANDIVQVVSQDVFVPTSWIEHNRLLTVCSGLTLTIFSTFCSYAAFSRCRSLNFMNTVYKVLVLGYPMITRLALEFLINGGDHRATDWSMDFLCGLFVLLYTIGFPWYVFTLVRYHASDLYHVKTLKRLGCLYADFRPDRAHFMQGIFAMQLAYVALSLGTQVFAWPAWVICAMQLGVEGVYVCALLGLKPYAKRELQLESIVSTTLKLSFVTGTTFFHYYARTEAADTLVLLMTIVLVLCHVGFSCADKVFFTPRRRSLSIEDAQQTNPDVPKWAVEDYLKAHARVKPIDEEVV